jgi:predicted dehydrogenase
MVYGKRMKIIFFGLGSIGKKYANIIRDDFGFELYAYRTGKGQEKSNLNIQEFNNLEEVFSVKPDIAFITNPTFLHVSTALECARESISLFIEKPISHSLEHVDELEKEIGKRSLFTYVAYNLRFHPVITHLRDLISQKEKPIYFRAICSSYLPNWRPEQDYSESYSTRKELGGGVTLDLSHEFDYIAYLFGDIKNIFGCCGKISDLDIESEDILEAQITCDSGIRGNLHLDFFSRKNERKIQIYYNNEYIEGDLLKNTVKIVKKDGEEEILNYRYGIDETYRMQIQYFFEQYFNKNYNIMNNFSEALKTFKTIMKFKKEHREI